MEILNKIKSISRFQLFQLFPLLIIVLLHNTSALFPGVPIGFNQIKESANLRLLLYIAHLVANLNNAVYVLLVIVIVTVSLSDSYYQLLQ